METNFNSPLKPQAQAHAPSEARIIVDGAGALDSQPESGTDLMKDVLAWQTHDLLADDKGFHAYDALLLFLFLVMVLVMVMFMLMVHAALIFGAVLAVYTNYVAIAAARTIIEQGDYTAG